MADSKFYYDGMAYGKDAIRDLPMYAIHAGQDISSGWDSADVNDAGGFRMIMAIVNPQVPVFLAMPRMYQANFFPKDRIYDKVSVSAYRYVPGSMTATSDGYRVGGSIVMVLKDVRVLEIKPIMQWQGLPVPPQVQKNYLERKIGRETYIPVAVKLFAYQGDVV